MVKINFDHLILKSAFIKIHLGIFNIIDKSSKRLLLFDKNLIIVLDLLLNILKKIFGILPGLFFRTFKKI